MADTTTDVLALIRKKLPAGKTDLKMDDRLEDLGIDSLGTVELIFELEEKFNIQIPYNANDSEPVLQTVAEVVGAIQKLVDKKNP